MNASPEPAARAGALVVCAGVVAGVIAQNAIPAGAFHDDGQYVILARSIAEHGTYRFDNLPGAPPGLHYPPGFPAVLALVWLVTPGNIQILKFANALLMGGAAFAIFAFARRVFSLGTLSAAVVSIMIVASDRFLWLNGLLVSETLFVLVLYGALTVAAARREASSRWQIGIGALAGCAALVRSLADPLGPILVFDRLWRGKRRDAAIIAAAWCAVIAPWKLWLHVHANGMPAPIAGAYGEYSAWWRAAFDARGPAFVWETVETNMRQLPITVSALGWAGVPALQWSCAAAVAAVAMVGAWTQRREAVVSVAFACCYVAIVLVWPFEPDRFLWMLAPIAGGALAAGVRVISHAVRAKRTAPGRIHWAGWVAAGAALAIVAGIVPTYINAYRARPWENGLTDRGNKGKAAARLAAALPDGARIATDFDELVSLRTGRIAVPARGLTAEDYVQAAPDSVAAMRLKSVLAAFDVTHVIVADAPTLSAVQWLRAHGVGLEAVAADSAGAIVFARTVPVRPPAAADAAPSVSDLSPVRK